MACIQVRHFDIQEMDRSSDEKWPKADQRHTADLPIAWDTILDMHDHETSTIMATRGESGQTIREGCFDLGRNHYRK